MRNAVLVLALMFVPLISAAQAKDIAAPPAPAPSTTAPASIADANNALALDLYAKLAADPAKDKNLFFSPFSISTALAMTYVGARGDTAFEMAEVLRYVYTNPKAASLKPVPPSPADIAAAYRQLLAQLNDAGKNGNFELHAANSLWAQKGFDFLPDYATLVTKNFDASLDYVDFKNDTEAARTAVNSWVEKKTNDKIKELLAKGAVNADTRLVLVNAIYFKAQWSSPFPAEMTEERVSFTSLRKTPSGPAWNTTAVPMMTQTNHFRYVEKDGVQALELPYKGGNLAMVIILPPQSPKPEINVGPGVAPTPPPPADEPAVQIADFEATLTTEKLNAILAGLNDARVEVHIPKWKVTCPFELTKALQDLGMKLAFRAADFSGMDGKRDLFISAVVHKAFIDVDEKGTEAAAANRWRKAGGGPPPKPPVIFRADHPFIYLIRDTKSGAILFIGRVIDPTKQ